MCKPAKMHCVLLQQMLLALVLTLSNPFTNSPTKQIAALPITSKPIENTVENMAWQAWIMLPPQQQNLQKSRKVTPKSIFILPNRVKLPPPTNTNGFAADGSQFLNGEVGSGYAPLDCPPGHRQYESRCIATVNIDQGQLLIQELQIVLEQGGGGAGSNQGAVEYDYDYDDDSKPMVGNFEPPLMLNGGGEPPILIGNNYDDSDRLPVEDAPLKFNIFREKFPTDGTSAAENSNETSAVYDPMAMMENGTVPEGWKAVNITELWTDLANKMQMENDDVAAGPFFPTTLNRSPEATKEEEEILLSSTTTTTTSKTTAASPTNSKVNSSQGFSLSDIDAIMLPAATTTQSHQSQQHQQQHQNIQQQFAIFKDDSAMQLFAVNQDHEEDRRSSTAEQQKTTEIMDLLKVDALLPLINIPTGTTVTRSTVTPLPSFLGMNTVHKETLDTVTEVTTTTTFPTPLAEILKEVEGHASQERDKEERTRSVTLHMLDDDLTTTNEIESDPLATTTVASDAASTTIIDELPTIPSVPINGDAAILQPDETIAEDPIQREIVAVTEQEDPAKRLNDFSAAHEVRKKSKVEPVGVELLDAADYDEETTPLPTPPEFEMLIPAEVDSVNALTNVAGAAADLNRFTEKNTVTVVGAAALNNEVASVELKTDTTTAVNTATTKKSEIDIATELRIINELVKGKRQGTASTLTTTTTATKATSTESTIATPTTPTKSTTTTTIKSNTAPIKNNNDLKQETTATSVKTSPTTIKNDDVETTTTTSWILNAKSGTTPSHKSSIESGNIVTDTKAELNSKSNSAPTTTTESTATLWSKILPFLNFGSTTTATTTTAMPADAALSSADSNDDNSSSLRSSSGMNRRNSKIIRINNLSTNSLNEMESKIVTTKATTTTVAAVSSTTTTTELPTAAVTPTETTEVTAEDTSSSSFWWLPIGWSLESTAAQSAPTPFRTHKNAVTPVASAVQPESLLLRFWNAFPGNQKRS